VMSLSLRSDCKLVAWWSFTIPKAISKLIADGPRNDANGLEGTFESIAQRLQYDYKALIGDCTTIAQRCTTVANRIRNDRKWIAKESRIDYASIRI
jgi:hypothetical protein